MDCREKLINGMRNALANKLSADDAAYVMNVLAVKLNEYELTDRCTELAVIDDSDEVILKNYRGCLLIEGKSQRTVKAYCYAVKAMAKEIGKHLRDIKTNDIRVWMANSMISGKKHTTLSNQRNYANTFFTWMKEEGYIEENPCDPIKPVKTPHVERKAFSDEEIDALRYACKKPIERALIEFLLSSGVRNEECCNMLVSDVDLSKKTVFVRGGKGNKDRTTYISPVCKKYLVEYLNSRKYDCEYLFASRYAKKIGKYTTDGILNLVKKIAKRANVENVHPHRFRRTLATTLAKRGMPIQEIQKILGHAEIATTQRYIDTDNTSVESSYRKFVA